METLMIFAALGTAAAFDRSGLTFFVGAGMALYFGAFLVFFACTCVVGFAYAVHEG